MQVLFQIVLSYGAYAFVTAFTPGPNNILALYAVSQNGWRRGRSTLLGIWGGFFCVMLLCAFLCYELTRFLPSLTAVMKYIGAAYILWLAFHVARSRPENGQTAPTSFWRAFFLQFVNVKIILYAVTIYTGYVLTAPSSLLTLLLHALFLTAFGMAGNCTWALAGGVLQSFLTKHYRPFNLLMGGILAVCAIQLLV